ncbi:hypothetical protein HanXRQr2_Chr15g0713071 [Helianthus annuus]|nr:hypothetical protein HanXRQr2_Chr15g0713071 [Helianthus annuus]
MKLDFPSSDDTTDFSFPEVEIGFPTVVAMVVPLFFRQPPPMGTLRRAPPLVQ